LRNQAKKELMTTYARLIPILSKNQQLGTV
jgi:hypothetical protein